MKGTEMKSDKELRQEFSMSQYASRDDLYEAMLREIARLRCSASPREQWTVDRLATALAQEKGDALVYIEHSDGAKFAGVLSSYRGYYEQLAIEFDALPQTVSQLVLRLRGQVGETVTGYKGGKYRISNDTPVWAAGWGECGEMIVGVDSRDGRVTLMTEVED
jgi:hypothetical protein